MPYNGSGTFSLAQAPFVPSTVISSSAMNSDLSDIATNGLTNAVTKDGQTTITGAFKGFAGTVGAPMYSFSADTDCGMYRIGANNIGISVNATKILDIATTGLSVIGALSCTTTLTVTTTAAVTGQTTLTGGFLSGDGTVLLPGWSFVSDPNSGVYRIGADNIGVAVNATKILDISTTGLNVIGAVSSNGTQLSPVPQAVGMVNGTIVETRAANATTFAIKTLAGADPSATDIVYFVFRNVTAATGNYVVLSVTAALSLVVSSGSTLGTVSSNVPFKLWLVAFNDASTVRLGIINCVLGGATPTSIYPLAVFPIASAVSEGGAGGADTAQVFYANATVTSKAYSILGSMSYETGLTTAGAWTAAPTRINLLTDGGAKPGDAIQPRRLQTSTTTDINSTTKVATALADSITPTSACHLIKVGAAGHYRNNVQNITITFQLYRGTGTTAIGQNAGWVGNGSVATGGLISCTALDFPQVSTATQYGLYGVLSTGSSSNIFLDTTGFTGTPVGFLELTEIVT